MVAKDETGLLGRITVALAQHNIYIIHLCASAEGGKATVRAVTRDSEKAKEALSYFVSEIKEREVVIVEFENKVGTLAPVAKLLGNENIGIESVYGTSGDGFKIVGVFSTQDNRRAAELINRESGALGVT